MPAVLRKFLPLILTLCTARQQGRPKVSERRRKGRKQESAHFPSTLGAEDHRPSPASRNPSALCSFWRTRSALRVVRSQEHPGEGGKEKGNEGKNVPELSWRRRAADGASGSFGGPCSY